MRRRELLAFLAGTAATWPLVARAQQSGVSKRIGYLTAASEYDTEARARNAAFREALEKLGWIDGRNLRIDHRWNANSPQRLELAATELVALRPDAIIVTGSPTTAVLLRKTQTIPIVFTAVADPVATGLVHSMAHPGGNVTGFTNFESPMGGKWLEILKEVAPDVNRVLVLMNSENIGLVGHFRAIEGAASKLGIASVVNGSTMLGTSGIERAIDDFARDPNGGMIGLPGSQALENRDLIVGLAARHRLPAIYAYRPYVDSGGLMSYHTDILDTFRRAASYVDRILRGEKPADLPVQSPTKFELVINLKVAKALGLSVPLPLLARADEVIE